MIQPRKLRANEIDGLTEYLNDKYCDPYVEVGCVNEVLRILDVDGHFEWNENTGKIYWRRGICED